MNKKQRIILIVGIIFAVLLVAGGSYAFWMWTSKINKNVVFNTANFEKYIVYNEGDAKFIGNFQPMSTFCESAHNTVSFYKESDLEDVNVSATIRMQVNSLGANIALSNDVYWVVTSGASDITCTEGLFSDSVVASGTFNGVTNGQILELYSNIEVTLTEQLYTVWVWIDSNGTNLSDLSGETVDTNIWTDFEMAANTYIVTFDPNGGDAMDSVLFTTSGEHVYNIPYSGTYKLEVWGAQGGMGVKDGASKYMGGYGGYSSGFVDLNAAENIYINVGGMGGGEENVCTGGVGGYNGGGTGGEDSNCGSDNEPGAGGGGATHIAMLSGELSTLASSVDSILIVAGGGGGGGYDGEGGSGGGVSGSTGNVTSAVVGTQTSGYAFGLGGNGIADAGGGGGGGGGYYGGSGGPASGDSGNGGSGYIGNSLLTNKAMYCYDCTTSEEENTFTYSITDVSSEPVSNYAKSGDGAAKITSSSKKIEITDFLYDELMPTPTRKGYRFVGWNTAADGSGTMITDDGISIDSDCTLYAIWEKRYEYYLYNSGDEYSDITGGWSALYKTNTSYWLKATVTKASTYLRISAANSSAPRWGAITTINKIDLSDYESLNFNVTAYKKSGSYTYINMLVMTERLQDGGSYVVLNQKITGTGIVSLDVSSLNGAYYIGFSAGEEEEGTAQISVDNVYLY